MQAEDRSERVKARNYKTSGGTGNAQPTMSNAKASEWAPSNEQGSKSGSRLADRVGVVPQLALRVKDAAQALGMSVDSFERYVEPDLKLLRLGKMKLVPTYELQRFVNENACRIGSDW